MNLGVEIELDTRGLYRKMVDYSKAGSEAVTEATRMVCEEIMEDSRNNYCPVVTGYLKSTGHVEVVKRGSQGAEVHMVYDAPYAWIVHERPASIGQGKNKYLSTPFYKADAAVNLSRRILRKIWK